jgi:hypothetical protein
MGMSLRPQQVYLHKLRCGDLRWDVHIKSRKNQVYLGCDQGSKSMEVAGVGNAARCQASQDVPPLQASQDFLNMPHNKTISHLDEHWETAFQCTRWSQLQRACWATLVLLLEGQLGPDAVTS